MRVTFLVGLLSNRIFSPYGYFIHFSNRNLDSFVPNPAIGFSIVTSRNALSSLPVSCVCYKSGAPASPFILVSMRCLGIENLDLGSDRTYFVCLITSSK